MFFSAASLFAKELTANDILEKVDNNFVTQSRIAQNRLIIKGRRGTRTITAKMYAEGTTKAFTVYLDPPREKDTKCSRSMTSFGCGLLLPIES